MACGNRPLTFRKIAMTFIKQLARMGAAMFVLNSTAWIPAARAAEIVSPLAGTWTLVAADVLHADGSRGRDYGAAPLGRLLVDAHGRYSLQIFKAERPRFASPDKGKGTGDEFAAAVLGASTHYGAVSVDQEHHLLTFQIEGSSFPNWEGTRQQRQFALDGDELSYQVPPRPNGDIPLSVWRRLH
jgi:hypothetical protein